MYPPAPFIWSRFAKKDLEILNPIYDDEERPRKKPKVLSMLAFKDRHVGSAAPIECKINIKFPKENIAMVVPPSVSHYDDRFWF
jgi:hypothetical protein